VTVQAEQKATFEPDSKDPNMETNTNSCP